MLKRRNAVSRLPLDIRKQLERKILEEDYRDFADLAQWTKDQGHPISSSSLHRHKQQMETPEAPGDIPAKPKAPAKMTLQDLEQESRYLGAALPRMAARQRAIEAELTRRYQGEGSLVTASDYTKPAKATRATQLDGLKAALLAGEPVNQVEAIRRGWGLRLGALVFKLRGQAWPIRTERDHGGGMARYSLPKDWKPPEGHTGHKKAPAGC